MPIISGITDLGTPSRAGGARALASGFNFPGVIVLQAYTAGGVLVERYLWITDTGTLRIGTAYPTAQNTDGVSVGAQT